MAKEQIARSRKRDWFDRGVQALARVTKGTLPEGYLCPLCYEGDGKPFRLYLADALKMELLSEEDVPPRSIGGRRIVLTCKACNSAAGHTVDAELRKMENVNDFWGRRFPRSRACSIDIDGLKVNAHAVWEDGTLRLTNYARVNSPCLTDQINRVLDRISGTQRTDWEFKLALEKDAWKRGWPEISLLRASYLAAFAAFGYRYVLRPSLNVVREQIRNPHIRSIPCFGSFMKGASEKLRKIGAVYEPRTFHGVAVQIGPYVNMLPLDSDDLSFYQRISDRSTLTLNMKEWPWPRRPEFAFDFDGSLAMQFPFAMT